MRNRLIWQLAFLMDKAGDGTGGGGGGGTPPAPSPELVALQTANAALEARLAALEGKGKDKDKDDPSLSDKARIEREAAEKGSKHEKSLESAMHFNIAGKDFAKVNESLLPKTVAGLFVQAEKENYGSAIEKANALKTGIVTEFFSLQANLDMLTTAQKIELDDFLKLTKNGKESKVENVYAMIFEPTLETLRKVEKARQLNNGDRNQTDGDKALAERMMKLSKKRYMGEKA